DRNRSHWSTSKTPSYTKSVSWQHHQQFNVNLSYATIFAIKTTQEFIVYHIDLIDKNTSQTNWQLL
ncbi:hypothetical protein POX35_22370, partial [Escherichia fergusonii]|uniref:hypothetical protein n=1 Tax=Escherichia fergusonii TaxID=564 RepID=UPI002FF93D7F